MTIKRIQELARNVLLPLFFWISILWIISLFKADYILPSPPSIASAFAQLCLTAAFWESILFSLLRILGGLGIGVIAGIVVGILIHFFPIGAILLRPLLTIVRSTPVASVVILVWSFTGGDILPFVISAMMVLPIVADELSTGLSAADPSLGEMVELFHLSPYRRFLVYRLPAAIPYVFGAFTTAVGFAWKAGIAAEIIAITDSSIGRKIYFSFTNSTIDQLWAWTLTIIILSITLEFAVKKTLHYVRRKVL